MPRGTIRERSRDVWQVQVSAGLDPETGRRRRLTRTVHGGKKAANRALTQLLTEVDDGAHRGPDATLTRLLDAWWDHASNGWQPATKRGYRSYRSRYLDEHGNVRLSEITGEWCDRLYGDLLKNLAPSTVYKVHVMLHQALGTAVRWGWLRWNPVDRANPPTVQRRQPTSPDRAKLKAAIVKMEATDKDYACMLHLQAVAGLRRAELAGLKWSDLDGTDLQIRRTVVLTDQGNVAIVQDDTKTHRVRRIPLDPATVKKLTEHQKRWEDRCTESGTTLAGGFMFPRLADPLVPMQLGLHLLDLPLQLEPAGLNTSGLEHLDHGPKRVGGGESAPGLHVGDQRLADSAVRGGCQRLLGVPGLLTCIAERLAERHRTILTWALRE